MSRFVLLVSAVAMLGCGGSKESAPPTTPDTPAAPAEAPIFPPKVDEVARGGVVQDANGAPVELASLWKQKMAVVVFYRGNW
jgi:hypothetical protein